MTEAMATYDFPSGDRAQTLEQFVQICHTHEALAAEHLYQGYFEPWLREAVSRPDLSNSARAIRERGGEHLSGLRYFLQTVHSTEALGGQSQAIAPYLQAEAVACVGDLRVLTFAYPCADSPGAFQPGYPRLSGIEVGVTGNGFTDCQTTNDAGETLWTGLPEGNYRITVSSVSVPPGYNLPNAADVAITEAAEQKVEIGFVPQPAVVKGFVYFDAHRSGNPQGQQYINNVPVDFYHGQERFDCVETCHDAHTGQSGYFEREIKCPGLIFVAPRQTIKVEGRILHPAFKQMAVLAAAGQTCDVAIAYVASLGQIQVSACLVQQSHGEEKTLPIPATFSLYRGTAAIGEPIRTLTTSGRAAGVLDGLEEGDYTLVAKAPNYRGQAIEPDQPPNGVLSFTLCAGQTLRLLDQFCFQPCGGRIMGMALDDACGEGVGGVPILLSRMDGHDSYRHAVTDPNGVFVFDNVLPGDYFASLEQTKVTLSDGATWIPSQSNATDYKITVLASTTMQVPPFRLKPEKHMIWGYTLEPDGKKIPFAEIEIQDASGKALATVIADGSGKYEYLAPIPGNYFVVPVQTASGSPSQKFPVYVNEDIQQNVVFSRPAPAFPPSSAAPNGNLKGAVEDIASYPILTEEIGFPSTSRPSVPGAPGAAPLGQIVEGALREVLAWRPRSSDPKGFVAALSQAFTCTHVEGRTKCTWMPRSYAVQADIGAVTGAQASIYARGKAALDQSLPLLDGLYSLRADADREDTDAVRAIVGSELQELINELGVEGGPRVQRVDVLFELLLGPISTSIDPEHVQGQLGKLREEFGLERGRVNTVEEEQNLTNFLILVDHVISLKQSWDTQRKFFDRIGTDEPFLGTHLVLLSRSLAVVAEAAQEVYLTMDSVFLGPAERQTIQLDFAGKTIQVSVNNSFIFPSNTPPLFVAELLQWVDRFASEEAPRLIQEGGKSGVSAFFPTIDELTRLMRGALIPPQDPNKLPAGYRTSRVQRALQELAFQLDETARLARHFQSAPSAQIRSR